ncbi:MAG: hypothetical protein K1X65_03965 [Caldilineales bacterium]|nr:hypothetical protein [Caldilineales bacterium]MCW5859280.1 hypothetical protein [Caldilineales bacterium]
MTETTLEAPTAPQLRKRLPYVWDYDIDEAMFDAMLAGEFTWGRLDRDWAAVRLLEYAPYREIVHKLGFKALVEGWPRWRGKMRSQARTRGLDFLSRWLVSRQSATLDAKDHG